MRKLLTILILFSSCVKSQPNIQINGSGSLVTINNGASTVYVNAEYFAAQTGIINFTDNHFQFSIPGYAGTGFTARSTAGYVEFKTSETEIDVVIGGNWSTASSTFDEQSECPILVDGVYNQSVTLTADDVTETYTITLPGGEKIVRLINGYTAAPSGDINLPSFGVYVQGIVTTGSIEIKRPVRSANKWLFIGNSITTGASGTHPAATGFPSLFREDGRNVQLDAFGARRILTTSEALADDMAAFVSDQMNGSATNELFFLLGTNNFTVGGGHSKSNFKLWTGYFVDALHSIRPDITIYLISPFNRTGYSTPNSQGATLEDYADAEQELQDESRPWLKIMYGKDYLSIVNTTDGLHPNQTGMQEIHDNFLIDYNLLNP